MHKRFSWRPYLAGALVGVLATLSVLVSTQVLGKTQFLGASTTFVRAAGFIEQEVDPARVKANPYFANCKKTFSSGEISVNYPFPAHWG